MKKKLLVGLALGVMMGVSGVANAATLIGDTITATGYDISPANVTIGDGVEFLGISNYLNFDFGASTLTISDTVLGGWSGFGNFVFSEFDETLTGVTIASNSGFYGSIVDSFSFDAHSITLDMSDSGRSWESVLVFNIATETAPVPEPATMLLFGTGLAGLVGAQLRRKK